MSSEIYQFLFVNQRIDHSLRLFSTNFFFYLRISDDLCTEYMASEESSPFRRYMTNKHYSHIFFKEKPAIIRLGNKKLSSQILR